MILAAKRELIEGRIRQAPLKEVRQQAADASDPRPFLASLTDSPHRPSLIAEVKKASPSQGVIREDFDPADIAARYRDAGADCLSVLTDEPFFQGHPSYLALCRKASGRPCLRKDFTIHEYDIWEARALEADAVLLIVRALEPAQLRDYRLLAEELGMAALVEAHDPQEAQAALDSGAGLIGINNRDLGTFDVKMSATEEAAEVIRDKAVLVSESGMDSLESVESASRAGARAVLIGTALCRRPDPGAAAKEIMGW